VPYSHQPETPLPELPWHLVTSVTAWGGLLCGVGVELKSDAKFIAPHESGLTFQWTVGIVKPGTGGKPDLARIGEVLTHLSGNTAIQFAEIVRENILKIKLKAIEWRDENQATIDECKEALSSLRVTLK
jgi:hypothetical protein